MKVTPETLTDERCCDAFRTGIVDERIYITAIGAAGAEYEDDDGEIVEPTENELEEARQIICDAINARASKVSP